MKEVIVEKAKSKMIKECDQYINKYTSDIIGKAFNFFTGDTEKIAKFLKKIDEISDREELAQLVAKKDLPLGLGADFQNYVLEAYGVTKEMINQKTEKLFGGSILAINKDIAEKFFFDEIIKNIEVQDNQEKFEAAEL